MNVKQNSPLVNKPDGQCLPPESAPATAPTAPSRPRSPRRSEARRKSKELIGETGGQQGAPPAGKANGEDGPTEPAMTDPPTPTSPPQSTESQPPNTSAPPPIPELHSAAGSSVSSEKSRGQTTPSKVIDFRAKPDDIDLSQHIRPAGTPAPTVPEPADDPLVLSNCLATDAYTGSVSTVQPPPKLVSKPGKETWFRVHPDPAQHPEILVIEDTRPLNKKLYVVSPSLHRALSSNITRRKIYRCVDTYGQEFYLYVKLPQPDGELDNANKDKHLAAEIAKTHWTLIVWDQDRKVYNIKRADDPNAPEPKWVERTPQECFELLFADAQIRSLDHPFARFLLGKQIS